jgi:hypothetical protein
MLIGTQYVFKTKKTYPVIMKKIQYWFYYRQPAKP